MVGVDGYSSAPLRVPVVAAVAEVTRSPPGAPHAGEQVGKGVVERRVGQGAVCRVSGMEPCGSCHSPELCSLGNVECEITQASGDHPRTVTLGFPRLLQNDLQT